MNRISRAGMMGALVAGLLVFVATHCTQAATLVWTGHVDKAWSVGGSQNWLNGGVPTSFSDGNDVVFDSSALQTTNINISGTVSPSSVVFSNTNTRLIQFTNGLIGGSASLTKTNNGTVEFGDSVVGSVGYTNSMPFSGGTVIRQGMIRFTVGANASLPYSVAAGGYPFGFGSSNITLNGAAATFGFRMDAPASGIAAVLTNDFVIGLNGGSIDMSRIQPLIPQVNLSGNMDLYGNLYVNAGNAFGGIGGTNNRVMAPGRTRLYNSCTVSVNSASAGGGSRASYEQNIDDNGPYTLTLAGYTGEAMVDICGVNTGLTQRIFVRTNSLSPAPVIFVSTNAMGGSSVRVCSNAYAGLAFDFNGGILSGMQFEPNSVLGIESNSAVNIDLSAGTGLNADIWLGSSRGAVYTGTLTPFGSDYKLGGGGCKAPPSMILNNVDALSGSNRLLVGNTNSYYNPGCVILATSNSYTGGTVLSGSKRTSDIILAARAAGSLGTGPITINRVNATGAGPVLQIEVPYRVFTNDIAITGQLGHATLNTVGPLTLRGDLTLYGTNALNIMSVNSNNMLMVFNPASGKAVTFGDNSRINQSYGLFDPVATANLPVNAGYLQGAGATLVLSPGFTWSDLIGARSWTNTQTPAQGQWLGRNFAARGAAQVIDGTGSFLGGVSNSWLGTGGILMGSLVTNADGTYYANAGVKIARDIIIGSTFTVTVPSQGPGWTNDSSAGVVQELAGTISGTGNLALVTTSISANDGILPELVLSGTSVWSGGWSGDFQSAQRIATGPGGISIAGGAPIGFIRFNGNASLPTGNGGATAYLQAIGRANAGQFGFLLTGASSDQVYSLTNGMRFLLSGAIAGSLGAAGGRVTLTNSMVSVFSPTATGAAASRLLVRDANSVFTLGSAGGAVKFSTGYAAGTSISGYQSPAVSATVMADRPTGINTLIKSGVGTLVLSNVDYTLFDGTGDVATNFVWQLGSSTAYLFDGVVRETGVDKTNSLRMMRFNMKGAIYGLSSDWTVITGTNAAEMDVSSAANCAFGFSAYGGNRVMNLRPHASGTSLCYGQAFADARWFLVDSVPIILNAANAEGTMTFLASDMVLDLSGKNREFTVLSTNYAGRIPALIKNSSASSLAGLIKTGPGRLILESSSNTYNGVTAISNGTLTVNGLFTSTTNGITVYSGGTLDGTGTVRRAVTVASGGTLSAGAGANLNGTLTISSNLVMNGTLAVGVSGIGAGQYDVVNVSGSVTLAGTLTVVPASGYEMPGGATIQILTATGGITGSLLPAPRGYSFVQTSTTLSLKRDSPGFIFRIQ